MAAQTYDPTTVTMPAVPVVVLWDGSRAYAVLDSDRTIPEMSPIGKAVTVARLRAIADLIEKGEQ